MIIALLLAIAGPAHAGWTQPQGAVYAKVWERAIIGTNAYFPTFSSRELPESYMDHALNLYVEGGLTDRWTLVVATNPLGWSRYGDSSTLYVGDSWLGVRRALLVQETRVAVELRVGGAPGVGEETLGSGTVMGDPFVYVPALGTAHYGGELSVGRGVGAGWFKATLGGLAYTRPYLDPVVHASLGGGAQTKFGLRIGLTVAAWRPIGNIVVTNVTGVGQTFYIGGTLDLAMRLTDSLSLAFDFGGGPASSNAATPSLGLGLEWKRTPG